MADLDAPSARKILRDQAGPRPGRLTGVQYSMTAANLKAWRTTMKFTQREAAEWLNRQLGTKYVSTQLSDWENGTMIRGRRISVPARVALAILAAT